VPFVPDTFSPPDLKAERVSQKVFDGPLKAGKAPQATFAEFALTKIARLNGDNFEEMFVDILSQLHENRSIDPFLKLRLMWEIHNIACQNSILLAKALQKNQEQLRKVFASLDPATNWLSPDDPEVVQTRRRADDFLSHLRDPEEAVEMARRTDAGLARSNQRLTTFDLSPHYRWTAWLHRDQRDEWTCSFPSNSSANRSGTLYVLERASTDGTVAFVPIGELKAGVPVLGVPERRSHLVEGRPVFEIQR